jgi:hypothetical protein
MNNRAVTCDSKTPTTMPPKASSIQLDRQTPMPLSTPISEPGPQCC